ncbi:MAG: diaminopimelate decarboxylase [Clostridia bacterium]|nr:diaminopimelate decarboxylase [Clostridia bacterium]
MPIRFCPSKEQLGRIIEKYPTPFHLYDEAMLRQRARHLNRVFTWNAGFKEYFAVKALPNPAVLTLLKQEGCGVDCASLAELMLAKACGFRGEEIMFSSNETPAEEYELARELGAIINLDDITHIDFLAAHGGIPEKICLRFNPGGDFTLGNTVMGEPGESKYGMTREQIFEAVERLSHMGVKQFALHSFLASNTTDKDYYPVMAWLLFDLARAVQEKTGMPCFMVNLSGGIGIPYRPEEVETDLDYVGEQVRRAYEKVFGSAGMDHVKIATELGRYMTGPCGVLVATAIHEKHIYKEYIGLDACAANLMRPAMYGAYHHIVVAGKEDAPATETYDVVGSLCENNDKFAIDRQLPKIDIGDLIIIQDTGAHGHSMGYNYNGKLRSAEILLREDGGFELIRRAETVADYFATLDVCECMKKL